MDKTTFNYLRLAAFGASWAATVCPPPDWGHLNWNRTLGYIAGSLLVFALWVKPNSVNGV